MHIYISNYLITTLLDLQSKSKELNEVYSRET